MQWVNYYQFTHPQEYWNACLKKAELELKQRHFLESENLRNRELGLAQERLSLDYQKFQTEQQNFHAQLAAQNEIAQVRAKTDLEVENIRSAREINLARERAEVDIGIEKFRAMHGMELAQQRAEADIGLENLRAVHAMDLAHFNADSAANLAKINGWNDILNGAIRGNAELSTTLANGRSVFLLWKTGLDNAVKPPIFISIPRNTADNKQSMNDEQWEAVKNVQIERYYRNPHSTPSPVSENPVNGKKSPNTDDVNPYLN